MKDLLKNKTVGFYIGLAGGCLGFVTTLLYLIYSLSVKHFNPLVFTMLLLGVAGTVSVFFLKLNFLPLVPALFFSLAFGVYINDRVIMFEEMINNIYGMSESGAILGVVVLILVFMFICVIASIVATFTKRDKTA